MALTDVVGRDATIARWWNALERRSLRLTEPRRFGKSTTLALMASRPPDGWICVNLTVQDAFTAARLVELTLDGIMQHASWGQRVKTLFGRFARKVGSSIDVKAGPVDFHLAPDLAFAPFDALARALADMDEMLERENKRLLIIWDEFPDAVKSIRDDEGPKEAAAVLAAFRALRQRLSSGRIRWFLTGSVGLHHVLSSIPESAPLNDVGPVTLGPLTRRFAKSGGPAGG